MLYELVTAYDADVGLGADRAYELVRAYEDDTAVAMLPLNDPVKLVAIIDPVTVRPDGKDTNPSNAEAYEAVVAVEELPNNEPVNEPVNDPVLICKELDTNPAGFPVNVLQSDAAPAT